MIIKKTVDKKRIGIIAIILSVFVLGAASLLSKNVQSESNIIGGSDGPTDIWVTDEGE
ncbi:hypothetical protein [Jeotgalibaca porci]|uniref:hypothetical protein n=1 Tax=Jeotgalibaca porci TaxID=1868793 RepID=UPI0035A026F1